MKISKTLFEKDLYPELQEASALSDFRRDCLDIAESRFEKGEISRRNLIKYAAMLGAAPLLAKVTPARAEATEVVLVNWGGDSTPAYMKAFGEPFEEATGIKLVIDGTGPLPSRIRAMVESGQIVWDVMDFDASKAVVLDAEGLLQPIDYSIVDRDKVHSEWAYDASVAAYIYSCVLAYDSSKLETAPNSWADFWDLEKFPGLRAMRNTPEGQIEACMMAAGRSIKEVYPIDLDLAVAKVKEIKDDLVAWTSGSQSQDLLRNGEVVMANVWHSRAGILHKETQGRLTWTWNQGLMNVDVWAVPKNNPAGTEAAMRFIASTQDAEAQVELLSILGNGPVNPAATELVPEDVRMFDPTQPDHRAVQAELNADWWNEPSGRGDLNNDALAREMWLEALAS